MKTELTITIALSLMVHIWSSIWWASGTHHKLQECENDINRLIQRVDRVDQEIDSWILKNLD